MCFISKLKELSKRTTFIRVTQQINEVFGTKDESKNPVFSVVSGGIPANDGDKETKKARLG